MPRKNKVLIYQDYVHNNGILYRRCVDTFGRENVSSCDADAILKGALKPDITLFVMPGGADLYYSEKLNGEGNQKIRLYVEQGGNYLGICAGAYYAAREIDWSEGEIAGPRELAFFNGKATGPVHEFLEDNDFAKSWKNIVDVTIDGEIYPVFYNGGPVFDGPGFGTYSKGGTCLVSLKIGKGTVVLSSPHIEHSPIDLKAILYKNSNPSYEWEQNNIPKFEKRYHSERNIWLRVLEEFRT